ncbi:choice-of-anchor E domain-containing protein [Moorena sp. SIO3B2]|uniref:choice-of-anchor E domain-containing protein n=1 Tax=Moorena sp. SIO3B2 TaxID=2607827 RepID=UPI0013C62496|nr:choice-of-anchor E domain-containing protein [Moorena sp. SIO3B2]NEP33046.1 choice-of-anchor E domain-containing protein [Moorena sp. SIO3B2]
MKTKYLICLATVSVLTSIVATTTAARSATIVQSASVPLMPTNINDEPLTPVINPFDTSLGTLDAVTIEFNGLMSGDARSESLDAKPATLTWNLEGLFTLVGANNTTLFTQTATVRDSAVVAAYDGTLDFQGESAVSFIGLTANVSGEKTFTNGSVFNAFLGTQPVDFFFSAETISIVNGTANILNAIATKAQGDVQVTYDYTPSEPESVPEPTTPLGLGLVAGLKLLWQRKEYR